TAADLGLADAGGADHQDVLGIDLLAQGRVELPAPPAAAQRHGDRALGLLLADDEAVELGDDLARGQVGHGPSGVPAGASGTGGRAQAGPLTPRRRRTSSSLRAGTTAGMRPAPGPRRPGTPGAATGRRRRAPARASRAAAWRPS